MRLRLCVGSGLTAISVLGLLPVGAPVSAHGPDSAPGLPAPAGTVIHVSTVSALQASVAALSSNTTIVIAPGTYHLGSTLWVSGPLANVTIRGATDNRHDVVLVGKGMGVPSGSVPFGIWTGNGVTDITIANLTIRDIYQHPLMFNAGTESPRVYNVRLVDAGEQFLKANPDGSGGGVDNGVVEYSVFEYTDVAPSDYTNGVDVHTGQGWIIRHNLFRRIRAASGLAGPAVLMWNGSSNTLVEGNTFIDCHREIALGLVQRTPNDHAGGIVRSNMIVRTPGAGGDVGIGVFDSPGTTVVHNTILLNGQYPNAIEYRYADTTGVEIINNLSDGGALARNGASATLQGNQWSATAAWFASPEAGDLHLGAAGSAAINEGVAHPEVGLDWDGQSRATGSAPDVGADEAGGLEEPWVDNGSFASGLTGWQTYGDISGTVAGGVFEYYWMPDATPSAAVVLQPTGRSVPSGTGLRAAFRLGNSSTARKRLTVLLHDADFSDLSVCTFWLAPGAPLRTYEMVSHTTQAWSSATISFYAATPGEHGGRYQLDGVTFAATGGPAAPRTSCIDPTAPLPPGGAPGPSLLTNGSFGSGSLAPWQALGTLTWQITGNVLEFVRPASGGSAGVILQPTGTPLATHEVIAAALWLGNTSSERKRVTVLLHDLDFSDLTACTWWIAPGAPLAEHQIQAHVADPAGWSNATLSVYAATVGTAAWIQLDQAVVQQAPGAASSGTECFEPGAAGAPLLVAGDSGASSLVAREPVSLRVADATPVGTTPGHSSATSGPVSPGLTWDLIADTTATHAVGVPGTVDLRAGGSATLTFESRLAPGRSRAMVQASLDGVTWMTLSELPPSAEWTSGAIELDLFAGHVVHLRFVLDAVAPPPGEAADRWSVRDVRVISSRLDD